MNNETHISTFARLLATENISVRHDVEAQTASFNVVDRILTLPRWKVVDSHLYDMLVGHEVAHALWTPGDMDEESGCLAACVEIDPEHPEHVMGFLNVVEDARIERMIKNRFPGLRRDFTAGYSYLHNTLDLFELSCDESKVNDMGLTDRLNVHFKLGILGLVSVSFTEDEQVFVDRMETTDTFEDVIELARDLYEKAKKEAEERRMSEIDIETEGGAGTGGNSDGPMSREMRAISPDQPETVDVFGKVEREKENRWQQHDKVATFPTPIMENVITEPDVIASYWDDHITRMGRDYIGEAFDSITKECQDWMRSEQPTVKNLVKQFEMRKAADEHKRTMTSKSGRLDTVKMIDYKWSEDIFAKNTIVREGKNHGIVIFVDWSGSMSDVIEPVMKQALTLAMFAQQANIPFEVYAFSDRTYTERRWGGAGNAWMDDDPNKKYWNQPDISSAAFTDEDGNTDWDALGEARLGTCGSMTLLRFLHSGMNRRDFQSAAELFYASAIGNTYGREGREINPPTRLQLNGTPLDECIIAAHKVVMDFRRKNGLQVVNCAILTDGCGHSQGLQGIALQNPYTGRVYGDRPEHRNDRGRLDSTSLLLISLKETTGCNLIGMYLHSGKNPLNCWGWMSESGYSYTTSPEHEAAKKMFKNENFCIADGESARHYDEAYVIAASTDVEQDLDLPSAASHVKLRNSFVKGLKKKGMSRTLIRRFVEMIAR
jgi:hypothetical protein